MEKILEVKDLHISFHTYAGEVQAIRGVSFDLYKGETLAIVGESGSGKSVTTKSLMRLLPESNSKIKAGQILFDGKDIAKASEKQMQKIRGKEISMIFQDPMTSLNPTMTIGKQISEPLIKHQKISKAEAKKNGITPTSISWYSESRRTYQAISAPIFRWDETTCCYRDLASM